MATITQKNGLWHARIRLRGVPAQSRSFRVKADAEQWATREEQAAREWLRRTPSHRHTLAEAIAIYLDSIGPMRVKPDTLRQYAARLRYWRAQLGARFLGDITVGDIRQALEKLYVGRSPASVAHYYAPLAAVFRACVRELEWVDANPCDRIRLPTIRNKRTRYLTDEELRRLFVACDAIGLELGHFVRFAVGTGGRRGEIEDATWDSLSFVDETWTIPTSKNDEPRIIPLRQHTMNVVERQWQEYIVNSGYSVPYPPAALAQKVFQPLPYAKWRAALEKAGISDFHFHDLRHTFASRLVQAGVPLFTVARLLGHKSVKSTERYAHLNVDVLREAVKKLPEID